ncbi:MAG: hypothetical protein GWM98_26005 [Nitrospinaceae bacterium]|nr:hypothetical protein [Nitrospinaceae bacterium]NIR57290.1 hypothetical protein [Nitrospinaceae bacterium]NIS87742.1 hypothetical protein [Nitrospinaceae bacterium]NIT84612.1 hypothetical protein [Nitrospinaceae bacterium]NIU46791.1 hypothetical protein [Nitrospinaceae bacterium]
MDKYDELLQTLENRLRAGDRFGLRTNLEGEGKFKDFQGKNEIAALREFMSKAREDGIEAITVRDEQLEKNVISEF